MEKMEALIQFVRNHATRGACKCGRCIVSEGTADKPTGHTIGLTFLEVGMFGDPDAETFKKLAQEAGVTPMPGKEVSYIQLGSDMGDQGTALLTMGLGHLLGAWKVMSPDTLTPTLPLSVKMQMAVQDLVSITREKEKPSAPPVPVVIAPPPPPPAPPTTRAEELENDAKLAEEALADPVRIQYEGDIPRSSLKRRGRKDA